MCDSLADYSALNEIKYIKYIKFSADAKLKSLACIYLKWTHEPEYKSCWARFAAGLLGKL